MSTVLQNISVALRSHRRTPGVAAAAILTLSVGIGLATAVFTVAEALLLRRLPVRDQDRIVVLWGELTGDQSNYPLGIDDARLFEQRTRALGAVGFYMYEGAIPTLIRQGNDLTRLRGALVSGDFFDVLDVAPSLGRALRPADDVRGSLPVIVLSHEAWQQKFGADPAVIGRRVTTHFNGVAYTIVGVMPQGIDFPKGADFWAPVIPGVPERSMQYLALHVIGRLAPGVTAAHARDEITAFYQRPAATVWQRTLRGTVRSLPQLIVGDTKPALLAFAIASALLLLITCINVANLLMVRGLARVREIAVRAALGATRARVIGQLLLENGLIALAGGVLGAAVATAAVRGFVAFAPEGVPRIREIGVNGTVLGGAIGLTALATLIFALAPAILTSRVQLQEVLRSDARQTAGRGSRLLTEGLVVAQVALAMLVLSAAGLVGRSLIKLQRVDLSLEPSNLLIAELAMRADQFDTKEKQPALLDKLMRRLESLPGVRGASHVVSVPFGGGWDGRPATDGQTPDEVAANPMLNMDVVSPSYFRTLGIPLVRGRAFTDEDRENAPKVVVISAAAARHYWPDGDPIGKRLKMGGDLDEIFTVVGVVPDVRYRELRDARASIYFPIHQTIFPFAPTTLAIRTTGDAADFIPTLRRVISDADPSVAVSSAAPFTTLLGGPLAQPRLNAFLLVVFGAAGVALAAIGLFGVVTTAVRQRVREIGVRLALGASPRDLRRMVLKRGLAIAAVGLFVGVAGALMTNRLIAALLYDVSPSDALTLGAVAALLLAVAALASAIPARSTTRIDPVDALRVEG
ncbi:MAG TPA: ABC transporter permease [Gemmatimonadaceae bacterium]